MPELYALWARFGAHPEETVPAPINDRYGWVYPVGTREECESEAIVANSRADRPEGFVFEAAPAPGPDYVSPPVAPLGGSRPVSFEEYRVIAARRS